MSGHIYTQSEIFAVVRQLLKKYHAESAILFGSYARQEADAASDIDLIVVGGSKFDPTDIFCIAEELHLPVSGIHNLMLFSFQIPLLLLSITVDLPKDP